ncbi:phospholipase C, phosphocholine-specific [Nitrospirillum sp. BR 11164]|uniref:phosphocholine-specific phospholipase C n=1 Tax=Nitrospirillum sp. BR 11164 TaxID=3104324 RepID=UPI002AFE6738|nr:phospholipase C, phosphocholine-specific [Nitrospirillum sp. BR 11164]MEA1648657.1 phospholipase C, phosphocholine-specific [Nitrospirillum sp. BR 11164]
MRFTRRHLLSAAGGAALLAPIRRALALSPPPAGGGLGDIRHVVILMQENRSFDHYFGTLRGVRGFHDRATAPGGNGDIWRQADGQGGHVRPFPLDGAATAAQNIASLPHSWVDGHAAWNGGRNDNWVPAKGPLTMAHYTRADIPFHCALADAFTICDAFFCSTPSATNPNRIHLMTGTADPFGRAGGPVLKQPAEGPDFQPLNGPPFSWTTYPERLEQAGISWCVYQGVDADGPFTIDVQDMIRPRHRPAVDENDGVSCFNALRFFTQFAHAPVGSPLHTKAMTRRPPSVFAADAKAGRLPAVSWLMPPHNHSEHPRYAPLDGAAYIATVLEALTANPETWRHTALFVLYDENDGFFDHVLPPAPPAGPGGGQSNVDLAGEINAGDGQPFGLGARVPMIVVSPWTTGGAVCSEVFDHTSVLRFLEARFSVAEPNISPWRRAVCGDLTSAFDFARAPQMPVTLPDTRGYRAEVEAQAHRPDPTPRRHETPLPQEPGQRPLRPTPYELAVDLVAAAGGQPATLLFHNRGRTAAVFHVFDRLTPGAGPARHTLAAGTSLPMPLPLTAGQGCDVLVLGPNGFLRHLTAGADMATRLSLSAAPGTADMTLALTVRNQGGGTVRAQVTDGAYGAAPVTATVAAGASGALSWPTAASDGWYDATLTLAASAGQLSWRLAGHIETGRPGRSDPAWGASS